MVEVYYYLKLDDVEDAVECGLKLSQFYDREVKINGEIKKSLAAYLNPKDDIEKYKSADYKCVKLELDPKYCYVADKIIYRIAEGFTKASQMYEASIIPIEKYIFGSYRIPECLVTTTVIAGQVSVLDKRLDSPIIFGNSEELYINNIIEANREENDDFNDAMLYSFYHKLVEIGKLEVIEDRDKNIAVFIDNEKNKNYTIMIPDLGKY